MNSTLHSCIVILSGLLAAGAASAQTAPPKAVAAGSYECWGNGQARMLMNFEVTGKDTYSGSDGKGRFTYDAASGRIAFKGGHLDGILPAGFTTVYHEPKGRPTVSFRSGRGAEASFCERVGK